MVFMVYSHLDEVIDMDMGILIGIQIYIYIIQFQMKCFLDMMGNCKMMVIVNIWIKHMVICT